MNIKDGKFEGKIEWKKGPGRLLEPTPEEQAVIDFLEAERMNGIIRLWPDFHPPQMGPGRPRDFWYEWGAIQIHHGRPEKEVIEDIFEQKPGAEFYSDPTKTIRKGVKRALKRMQNR